MPRRKLNITANDRRIEANARQLAGPLEKWIARATKQIVEDEIKKLRAKLRKVRIAKAAPLSALERELLKILVTYGVRSVSAAGKDMFNRAARPDPKIGPTRWKVTPALLNSVIRQKQVKVTGIANATRRRIRAQIRKLMLDASRERPRPSINELARRIRLGIVDLPPLKGDTNPELVARANRSSLIARTESAQDENTGIHAGMDRAGIDGLEWLAHTDGRSGDRHHERMNGKKITLADSKSSDKSRWFQTPLGNALRYPADPRGPIKDTANCRCTLVPVVVKG